MSSPEQLDQLVRITLPQGWISLGILTLLLAFVLAWGWFGAVSRELAGAGTLEPCRSIEGSKAEMQDCRGEAVLFLDPEQEGFISIGMKAHIQPASVPGERYGFIVGEVKQTRLIYREGRPWVAVDIALEPDKKAPSGLRWSSSHGPGFVLASSIPVTGKIIVPHIRPLSLLIPGLSRGGA